MVNRFMRLLILFDLPTTTKNDVKAYRRFVKYLKSEGYVRVQYSVYSKLCINSDAATTASKRLEMNAPVNGDIRYLVITERQYQNIININNEHSLQEQIITMDRTLMIGGMNNEA